MGAGVIYNVSVVAAFVAGMVALFAPCCISYLLPAYFANIFKERKQVLLMTLIYSLGIFVVMLPVVLGARVLTEMFFRLHDTTYIVGGAVMIAVGVLALLGIKLPMLKMRRSGAMQGKPDVVATFTLGIMSGITASCCAPVLLGVLTLSTLSPSMLLSFWVGVAYVLGMVTPLYLASLLIDKGNILERPWIQKEITRIRLGNRVYSVQGANVVAAVMFVGTGVLMLILTLMGKLGMDADDSAMVETIHGVAERVTVLTSSIPLANVVFGVLMVVGLAWFIRRAFIVGKTKTKAKKVDCCGDK